MELGLRGKAVVVTGGSKGIGLACARAFLDEGARVALVSREPANLDAALKQLRATDGAAVAVAADLVHPAAAKEMASRAQAALGPIDVLINSAGAARRYVPEDLTSDKAGYITGAVVPMDGGSNPVL
jgi:NAD(P)-dependent dehydrogenase (short-subunit alcohol dehydrogenase family)